MLNLLEMQWTSSSGRTQPFSNAPKRHAQLKKGYERARLHSSHLCPCPPATKGFQALVHHQSATRKAPLSTAKFPRSALHLELVESDNWR
jgi:hypothetical protein